LEWQNPGASDRVHEGRTIWSSGRADFSRFMKAITALVLVGYSLTFVRQASATAQAPDKIIIGKLTYYLDSNPLERFLEQHPEKRPKGGIESSGNWRGYTATWRIVGRKLVLERINVLVWDMKMKGPEFERIRRLNKISEVFPGVDPVIATWFSGTLVIPHGNLVEYVHMGYASTYEKYILYAIENGLVVRSERLTAKEFRQYRERQFEAFKKTEKYKTDFDESKKDGTMSDAEIDQFLFEFETETYLSMPVQSESR
jgi:hypothetical protein